MSTSGNVIKAVVIYACAQTIVVFAITKNPAQHAAAGMMLVAFIAWVLIFGGIMYAFRDVCKRQVDNLPHWQAWFFSGVITLALIEEAIAVFITNNAPWFGVQIGQAYFTASTNYFDVVLYHSVIMFLPLFFAWTWSMQRYNFSPNAVFLMFGSTGLLAEFLFSGGNPFTLIASGFWICVYGLMIWLPAYCLPKRDIEPKIYHYAVPFIASFITLIGFFFVMFIIGQLTGYNIFTHPKMHFPPMT